jgi:hypothetical protein
VVLLLLTLLAAMVKARVILLAQVPQGQQTEETVGMVHQMAVLLVALEVLVLSSFVISLLTVRLLAAL